MDTFTLKLALAPVICALIGWLTNYLAVKMLFHPRKPFRILGMTVQGIFPKRQKALAKNLGQMVQGELVSHEDVVAIINDPSFLKKITEMASGYAETLLNEKLTAINPMIAMFLNGETAAKIKQLLTRELSEFIPNIIGKTSDELEQRLDFSELVRDKVEAFSMDKLEEILFSIMKKEFRFIEYIGGVLGFMVGLVQVGIFVL